MEELEDYFKTEEFKSLSRWNKFKIRLKIAFIHTLNQF